MRKIVILSIILGFIFTGCKKNDSRDDTKTRTVITYIVADNSLTSSALNSINQMEYGWDDSFHGDLLVFLNTAQGNTLYRIVHDEDTDNIHSKVLKTYDTGSHVCTKEFIQDVIDDAMDLCPADSYAIDFWSHGSGWLPYKYKYPLTAEDRESKIFCTDNEKLPSSYFGLDNTNNETFEVYDLADAISRYHFDYIIFDACHMGSIECAFQMRNSCDYFISSAAEIMSSSFPYHEIVGDMFSLPANVTGIAQKFYEYYSAKTGSSATATVSVVESKKLAKVATELSSLVTKTTIPMSSIQQYGREVTKYNECFFDLEDFVQKTWGTETTAEFSNALSDAITYKAATPWILNNIQVNHFSGLSCYIPVSTQTKTLTIYKNNYSWATASGLLKLIE